MKLSPKDCNPGNRWLKFFRKWHRWPGVIMAFFFILWAFSGIVLNHRELFSGLDISRKLVPAENRYVNWNNAAVKSIIEAGPDSLLIYGNIGIWLTGSSFSAFKDFNEGFRPGIDNRKISSMLLSKRGHLYAGTLFGLFHYNQAVKSWEKINLPVKDERIQWLTEKEDKIAVLTRSEMILVNDNPENPHAALQHLPPPQGYDNKASLFRTIWVIHSGEIYGLAGKLIVDLLGLLVILLSITGALHFALPYFIRRLKKQKRSLKTVSYAKKTSAKWHKKAGIWIALFLLINTVTGMFLRPPLLIAIANARVGKIPWSVLDTPNPWEDKLRALIWDEDIRAYIVGTNEGLYYANESLDQAVLPLPGQPPLSVMGINVFEKTGPMTYLVGSFNGLYEYRPAESMTTNYIPGGMMAIVNSAGKPFGENMVSGYWSGEKGKEVYFDYNRGAVSLNMHFRFPEMPSDIIGESPISWWNFALEVHTGRIFKPVIGDFYILVIPLFGIFGAILTISGIIIWIKLYVRKHH
jgi:hypothetical protein